MTLDKTPVPPPREDIGAGLASLVRMLQGMFFVLRFLIVAVLLWVFFGGFFYVKVQEEAMVFRFGQLIKKSGQEVLTSGNWYWKWPYPIEQVKRIQAQRSNTIQTLQFWYQQNAQTLKKEEGNAPAPLEALKPGEHGYLLTGDANIMHMAWSITYRVTDAKKYYLEFSEDEPVAASAATPASGQPPAAAADKKTPKRPRGAEGIIENVFNNAIMKVVSTWPVEDVWLLSRRAENAAVGAEAAPAVPAEPGAAAGRQTLRDAVRDVLMPALDKLDLGIELQDLSVIEIVAPPPTADAFREVVDAAYDYQTEIARAIAYEKTVTTKAEGERAKIINDAYAYQTRTVASVKAEDAYFRKILEEYRKNPKTMLVSLYTDAIQEVLGKVETKYVIHSKGNDRQEIRLLLGPEPEKPKPAPTSQTKQLKTAEQQEQK